MAQISS